MRDEAASAVSRETGLPWREIYNAHASELVGYLWKLTGDKEVATDLMQDIFIAGMRDERSLREPAKARHEVRISGDGKTVYATDGGKGLLVMREDGSMPPITVTLPAPIGGFFASEHG